MTTAPVTRIYDANRKLPPIRPYLYDTFSHLQFAYEKARLDIRGAHKDTWFGRLWNVMNPLLLGVVYFLLVRVIFGRGGGGIFSREGLQLFDEADTIFVVMTADLSCLKNVRLVLETMDSLGYERSKVQLVLNRSNAYTGINVSNAESALGRKIDYQVINEYRGAISALNSGEPFMSSRPDGPLGQSVLALARQVDQVAASAAAAVD